MTHKQHPLGSGFAAASTAEDVVRGIDLAGKNAIVTGGDNIPAEACSSSLDPQSAQRLWELSEKLINT